MSLNIDKIIKSQFDAFFKENGYKLLMKNTYGRIVNYNIIQFVVFSKDMKRANTFDVDFAINLNFIRRNPPVKGILNIKPGSTINIFAAKGTPFNRQFVLKNDVSDEIIISEIKLLFYHVFDWFNNHMELSIILELFKDPIFCQPDNNWNNYNIINILLAMGKENEAKELLVKILAKENLYPFLKETCLEIKNILEENGSTQEYFNHNIRENIKGLKLENFYDNIDLL